MEVKEINLNHQSLFLGRFPYGKSQRVPVKLGRKNYYMDVDKNRISAYVCLYSRNAKSKYDRDAEKSCVFVKPDAMLSKGFFERLGEISKAQAIYTKYKEVLDH